MQHNQTFFNVFMLTKAMKATVSHGCQNKKLFRNMIRDRDHNEISLSCFNAISWREYWVGINIPAN